MIHYSEGEFPLDVYANNYRVCYRNGYHLENICECCCGKDIHRSVSNKQIVPLFVTDIGVSATYSLAITISLSDGTSTTYDITKNSKYKIEYIDSGNIISVVGVITGIGKINTNSSCSCDCCNNEDYIIKLDASTENASSVLSIRTSNIRSIIQYIQYADEDTTILNGRSNGVSVAGDITEISLVNATIDDNGNVYGGKITTAAIDNDNAVVTDGCAIGVNNLNHQITVTDAAIVGGTAIDGTIVSGVFEGFTITSGTYDADTKKHTDCSVYAKTGTIVAKDCTVVGSKVYNGTVINPVIKNSTVIGGTRTGTDMVTTQAVVIGETTFGGCITGGTLSGGTASGMINDKPYMIVNGVTTGGTSINSTVTNGKIVTSDSASVSTVYGGIATCDSTVNGTTVIGGANSYIKPEYSTLPTELTCHCPVIYTDYRMQIMNIIIWFKNVNTSWSNVK